MLDGFVFEYVTDAETFDGGVLFPEVTVERGLASDFRGHVLNAVRCGFDGGAVCFVNADEFNVESADAACVRKSEEAIALNAGVRLYADAG